MKERDRRYQVFVSSTYLDLVEERQEIIHALLELDCIPSGMEIFPAADEDQWSLIKSVIDDCDYYIVVIGGRYGSTRPDGMSYTQMEYEYALETGKPILAFLHREPGQLAAAKSELDPEKRARLEAFRTLAEKKAVRYWTAAADLGSQVSRSVVKLIKSHPAVGWIRGDQAPSGGAAQEILRLRRRIDELEVQVSAAATQPPSVAAGLAHGSDSFDLGYEYEYTNHEDEEWTSHNTLSTTWDAIFAEIGPLMIDRATEPELRSAFSNWIRDSAGNSLWEHSDIQSLGEIRITDRALHTVVIQLKALGLIRMEKPRTARDPRSSWALTRYGDLVLTRLRAIPSSS